MASFIAIGVAAIVWLALLLFFRHYRIWLMFYGIAAVGLAFLLIFAGTRLLPLERWLEMSTAYSAHAISQVIGIPTDVFEVAPDILVWVIVQEPGWTVVRVDLECSGLLEMSVLSGLLLFYPAWSVKKRVWLTLLGCVATYGANIVRVLSIILILHIVGKRSIFVAHTIAGRLIFFVLVTGLYWAIFTQPTIRTLAERLRARMKA
ncbi:MAG: exosortase family protein XrtG [Chloroflexota bacterium]|nr:exosortase family protein XrtG [Chloroflexota bacterium]